MKRPSDRRTVLMAAGVAAVAAAAGTVAAQSTDVSGAISFASGKAIPEGHIQIYLEDPAIRDGGRSRLAEIRVKSDGGSETIDFSFSGAASTIVSRKLRIVARLEREDGWLLARGSAQVRAGSPVYVTLNEAMY